LSRFVRSNSPGSGRLPTNMSGTQPQRLDGKQVAVGETFHLKGNADIERDIQSSLEIIAQERLLEVENEAKSLIIRARGEAQKILEQANAQAKALLDQAQSEVDTIRDTAHEEGFKTGYTEGYTDATAQVSQETQELLAGAQTLVEGAYLAEKRVMKHFEARTLELIRHIVRQIINREMADSPATMMGMVERATASLYLSGKVQLVVSAQVIHDLRQFAADSAQSLGNALDGMSRFEFIADPLLERNQIYIIGQDSCFDLSPDTQLEHMLSTIEPQFNLPRDIEALPNAMASGIPAQDLAPVSQPSQATDLGEVVMSQGASAQPEEGLSEQAMTELSALSVAAPDPTIAEVSEIAIASESLSELSFANVSEIEPQAVLPASSDALADDIASPTLSESSAEPLVDEADPVAWEEFPADLQQLDGFPAVEDEAADAIETNSNLPEANLGEPTL
jgi:flagellar assembly protein FliH